MARATARPDTPKRRRSVLAIAGGIAALFVGAPTIANGQTDDTPKAAACAPDNGGLTLPPGFCATVFADGLTNARHLTATDDGRVYVAISDSRDGSTKGGIVGLKDNDGDGRADESVRFGDRGGNGIASDGDWLYFAPNDGVVRYRLDDDLRPDGAPDTIVSGLPTTGDHVNKTVVLAGDDRMYVNIGSASNACQVQNRTLRSPGVDPCPELAVRAGVWEFSATAADQTQASGRRLATGLRNMVALAFQPETQALYGAQNGRDQLDENWPELYSPTEDLVLPAEELFRIEAGKDYGWPYCYFDPQLDRKVLAPEYGGDGEREGRCDAAADPLATFPAHWAPLSMLIPEGDQFPERYRNGAFVAFHGSRFDPASQPEGPGYNVAFVPFENGEPRGDWSVFADGFAGTTEGLPASAQHRPVGLAEGPNGELYISDDVGGRIWRVVQRSDTDSTAGTPTVQMQTVLATIASFDAPPIPSLPPSAARNLPAIPDWLGETAARSGGNATPEKVGDISHVTIPNDDEPLLARVYTPEGNKPDGGWPVTVYYHGGGWVLGNLSTYDASARALANRAGSVVVSVAYRLAPENKFPTAANDAFAAYTWVLANTAEVGGDPTTVSVAGESAGGNLATGVALRARAEGVTLPVHQLLIYPVTNYAFDTPSYQIYADAVPLDRPSMEWFWSQYLPDSEAAANPIASPLRTEDLSGMPPTTVILAEIDPLRSEGQAYAQRLADAGAATTLCLYRGVTHEFFGMGAVLPEARSAQEAAAAGLAGRPVNNDPACAALASNPPSDVARSDDGQATTTSTAQPATRP